MALRPGSALGGTGSGSILLTSKYAGSVIYSTNCNDELAQVTVNKRAECQLLCSVGR
jgi:hypothetical protein